MTVLITGANGFVGSSLARRLNVAGIAVMFATRSRPQNLPANAWRQYDLAWNRLPPHFFDGIDAVVHCAVVKRSRGVDGIALNVKGTELLFTGAQDAGVGIRIFLSSLAAHANALSGYGRQKYELQARLESRCIIIRPGLVLGHGGLFQRLVTHVRQRRLFPVFDGGNQPLQTVHVDDLTEAIIAAIVRRASGTFTIAEPTPVPYRIFIEAIGARLLLKPRLINVPFVVVEAVLSGAETLRIPLPVDRDNVLGLRAMISSPAEYEPLLPQAPRPYGDSLDEIVPAPRGL